MGPRAGIWEDNKDEETAGTKCHLGGVVAGSHG